MKKLLLFFICCLFAIGSNAQSQSGSVRDVKNNNQSTSKDNIPPSGFQKENLRFGGNFGAVFGEVSMVDISPTIGYQFYKMFQAGIGIIYNYYSDKNYSPRLTMHVWGGNVYTEFRPIRQFFLRAEYGLLNYSPFANSEREWIDYPMLGGGLFLPMGQTGGLTLALMWNLAHSEKSLYANNPTLRIGFSFGL